MAPHRVKRKNRLNVSEHELGEREATLTQLAARVRSMEDDIASASNPAHADRRTYRKLYTRYAGLMRHLTPAQKEQVGAVKETNGIDAAITIAKAILRGSSGPRTS